MDRLSLLEGGKTLLNDSKELGDSRVLVLLELVDELLELLDDSDEEVLEPDSLVLLELVCDELLELLLELEVLELEELPSLLLLEAEASLEGELGLASEDALELLLVGDPLEPELSEDGLLAEDALG